MKVHETDKTTKNNFELNIFYPTILFKTGFVISYILYISYIKFSRS